MGPSWGRCWDRFGGVLGAFWEASGWFLRRFLVHFSEFVFPCALQVGVVCFVKLKPLLLCFWVGFGSRSPVTRPHFWGSSCANVWGSVAKTATADVFFSKFWQFCNMPGFPFFRCEHVFLFREKRGQDRAAGAGEDHHTRRESLPRRSWFHGCVSAVFLQVVSLHAEGKRCHDASTFKETS